MATQEWPPIIQGGMGVGVSNWRLARSVSQAGQLGVVSGTGIDTVLLRRLQDGDLGGHMRRALSASPWPKMAQAVVSRFYLFKGRVPGTAYARLPLWTLDPHKLRTMLAMLGGFVEVWLAKERHSGKVGLNLLTKVALPNLPIIYGAMHAGVDVVLMGAGIPREIPGALDDLARHQATQVRGEVVGQDAHDPTWIRFDPASWLEEPATVLPRPAFFPIIAANSLALLMAKKASGDIQGFVVEGPSAGGHNAPPRGAKHFDTFGQPVYSERDQVDYGALKQLGYPFWLAGGLGRDNGLRDAWRHGATGIQVGTLFAYCRESGLTDTVKTRVIQSLARGTVDVFTDPLASPTGFPFKVAQVPGTLSDSRIYADRSRVCDVGYLREMYVDPRGMIGYRCASEPVADYVRKGGAVSDTMNRKCLCNGLMAAVGYGQVQPSGPEKPIVTTGDGLSAVGDLAGPSGTSYSAHDVIRYLLDGTAFGAEGR